MMTKKKQAATVRDSQQRKAGRRTGRKRLQSIRALVLKAQDGLAQETAVVPDPPPEPPKP